MYLILFMEVNILMMECRQVTRGRHLMKRLDGMLGAEYSYDSGSWASGFEYGAVGY